MDNIFKPFKRAGNVKFIGGFGIGLSLVAKVAEIHNAEVNIQSTINKGTRVEIAFKRIA